jgi:AcrR family transcriptional regulator
MTDESTRERRSRRTREQILETARALVLETGVDGLSLREVARRLDYSPGALYTYFADKDALLDAMTAGVFEGLGRYFERVPEGLPAPRRLDGLGVAYLDFATENPEQYLLVFTRIAAPATMRFDEREATPYPWSIVVEACQAGVEADELATTEGYGGREIFFHFFALHHGLAMLRLTRMRALPDEVFGPIGVAVRDAYVRSLTSGGQKERS